MSRSNQLAGLLTADPPSALDTINEINTALGNDAALSTTLTNNINAKASKSGDTFTGNVGIGKSPSAKLDVKSKADNADDAGISIEANSNTNRLFQLGEATGQTALHQMYSGNTEKIRLHANGDTFLNGGNVGIGEASPSEKLVVSDNTASQFASVIKNTHASGAGMKVFGATGTQYSFIVRDYTDNTNSLVVLGNGKVGIGITSPGGRLHIKESASSLQNVGDENTLLQLGSDSYNNTYGGQFEFRERRFSSAVNGSHALALYGKTALNASATADTFLMTIQSNGNVGIGETSPDCKLVILNSGSDSLRLKTTGGHGTKPRIYFDSGLSGTNYADKARIEGGYDSATGGQGGFLAFRTKDTSEASQTRMTIDSSGHIKPGANNAQDLGENSTRWRNIYTNDLNLSNIDTGGNDVDGTEGSWTLQEGAEDLYVINRQTGRKFKFNLIEV